MIPKTIHYCWFGNKPKPQKVCKCIDSWKNYCAGWQFIEWNEGNYNIDKAPLYVKQAYDAKNWAKVSDYVRLKVVYEYGGVYLDTDVEILKELDPLLCYDAYFGLQFPQLVNTGLGFGAVKGISILKEMMQNYENISFINTDGSRNLVTCVEVDSNVFLKYGIGCDNVFQILDGNVAILPIELLNPFNYLTCELNNTDKAYSIHWCHGSWIDTNELIKYWLHIALHKCRKLKRRLFARLGKR